MGVDKALVTDSPADPVTAHLDLEAEASDHDDAAFGAFEDATDLGETAEANVVQVEVDASQQGDESVDPVTVHPDSEIKASDDENADFGTFEDAGDISGAAELSDVEGGIASSPPPDSSTDQVTVQHESDADASEDEDDGFGAFEDAGDISGAAEVSDVEGGISPPADNSIDPKQHESDVDADASEDEDDDFGAFEEVGEISESNVHSDTKIAIKDNEITEDNDDESFGDFEDTPARTDVELNDEIKDSDSNSDEEFGDFGDFEEPSPDIDSANDDNQRNPFIIKATSIFNGMFNPSESQAIAALGKSDEDIEVFSIEDALVRHGFDR